MRAYASAARPVDLIFGAYRGSVLGLLLLRPGKGLHVREISRLTAVPAGSLHRELRALTDAGLLLREQVGNQVRYEANRSNPIFPELAAIFRKTAKSRKGASRPATAKARGEKLRISPPKVEAICRKYGIAKVSVFGSAARNELKPGSDVDVMVEFLPESRASLLDLGELQDELSAAFGGRRVDIATPEILRDPLRRKSILPDLKAIYSANE